MYKLIFCSLPTDEDSVRNRVEQEEAHGNCTDDLEKYGMPFSDSPQSDEAGKSMKREDGKLRTLSGCPVNSQGKNVRINIHLTTRSRTFSAISYLLREDLINQSSQKCGPEGDKLHLNKAKLHQAEKMIRGGFIELYKGLGYLEVYRYNLYYPKFLWFNELDKILKLFTRLY